MTLAEMAALHGRSFVYPRPWSEGEIAGLLAGPLCFVLEEAQGFLIGRVVAGEAELLTIAVEPAARRSGVGGQLLDGFLEEVRRRGADTVFLEVAADNIAARALYERAGFQASGLRRGYYQAPDGRPVDAVMMSRPL